MADTATTRNTIHNHHRKLFDTMEVIIPLTRISQKIGKSTCIQTVRTSLKSIGPIKILFIYYYSPLNSDSNGHIGDQLR